jgi:hypothetical protein
MRRLLLSKGLCAASELTATNRSASNRSNMEDVLADGTIMLDTYICSKRHKKKRQKMNYRCFFFEKCVRYFSQLEKNGSSHA